MRRLETALEQRVVEEGSVLVDERSPTPSVYNLFLEQSSPFFPILGQNFSFIVRKRFHVRENFEWKRR